jgi:ABC-2 type transport system permease protein/oleandomycin transport system permease protein
MNAAITMGAERIGVGAAFRHSLTIARRNLLQIKSDPEQLVGMTVQPIMFLMLFVYVFGGAIAGSSRQYLQYALPGVMVQGIAFTPFATALGLNVDFTRGLIDRFRSLPIARSAVIGGRIAADTLRIVWGVAIMTGVGVLLGFRFGGGVPGAIGGMALITAFGIAICWPMALLGVSARTPEAVNTFGFLMILPLTFMSSTFAPVNSMPGWLQAFVKVNPITFVVDATRGLMVGGEVTEPLIKSLISLVAIVLVFAPLAVAKFRRRI